MRFLVDECTGPKVAQWLRSEGHEVFSVFDEARGISDEQVFAKAFDEKWILLTNDKDFGAVVFRERREHYGIIFLRLADELGINKIEIVRQLISNHADKLSVQFVTVTENKVRFT
ncbi:hypothetical protein BH10ACI2_BH10ACI2_09800 [soil metagenome]